MTDAAVLWIRFRAWRHARAAKSCRAEAAMYRRDAALSLMHATHFQDLAIQAELTAIVLRQRIRLRALRRRGKVYPSKPWSRLPKTYE